MTPLLWMVSIALVVVGIIGIIVPGLPGSPLIFGGLLLTAWADNFQNVSVATMIVLGGMTVLALVTDFISGSLGAKRSGASREAVIGAALGALIGIFFGFVGVFFGPFIGAVLGELLVRRNLEMAGRVGFGTWIGFVLGIAAKLMLSFAMVGIFILAYLF